MMLDIAENAMQMKMHTGDEDDQVMSRRRDLATPVPTLRFRKPSRHRDLAEQYSSRGDGGA